MFLLLLLFIFVLMSHAYAQLCIEPAPGMINGNHGVLQGGASFGAGLVEQARGNTSTMAGTFDERARGRSTGS